jgi:uncharacterized protein
MIKMILRQLVTLWLMMVSLNWSLAAASEVTVIDPDRWTWQKEVFVPMRDGVNLSTDVILPKNASGPLATALIRTPYDKDGLELAGGPSSWYRVLLEAGYALVLQNERGRQFSEGSYSTYLAGDETDGFDTVQWIAKQPWSNGKVGTAGCSSSGESQWPLAASHPPALAAMIPGASGSAIGSIPGNYTQGSVYRGGIPQIGVWAWWYHDMVTSERLLLPPKTTQEQRIRLRNSFSLMPLTWFYKIAPHDVDLTNPINDAADLLKQLPSKDVLRRLNGALTPFDDFITWTPSDPRWTQVPLATAGFSSVTPTLHINTWHDLGAVEMTRMFGYIQDKAPDQYLIMGSGPHCAFRTTGLANLKFGDLDVGDARYAKDEDGYRNLLAAWFDHYLRGADNGVTNMPKVQLHIMHRGWISGNHWPLERTRFTKYYLDSVPSAGLKPDTRLGLSMPAGAAQDTYLYDPGSPVPSRGGTCCGRNVAVDQREVEARADVLSYTSAPLAKGVTVAGPIEVVLWVSSSAKDTDFTAKLVDVYPDGKAINLSDDGFRVRYREGFDKKVLMKEGEVYQIKLTNLVTGNFFQPGHRIRLDISSSNFPAYERNLNTGGNNFDETQWVTALNSIHHEKKYPSHIVLPLVD